MKPQKNTQFTIVALLISIIHFVPFYITSTTALKPKTDLSSRWIPGFYPGNFVQVTAESNILNAVKNTLVIAVFSITLIVIIASLAAYPLSRFPSTTNKLIRKLMVSMIIIPPFSVMVPLLSMIRNIGGISSYWAIVLVLTAYQLPLAVFLFTNFLATIPLELDESAKMDGAHSMSIYFFIILPLLKPMIATVVILTGVSVWNDYQFSLYLLQNPDSHTITLSITSFFSQYSSNFGKAAASTLMAVIPITILFVCLQKYFLKGAVEGSFK